MALAPVSVLPEYQGKGIGGKLMLESHKKAKELGYKSIVLIGYEKHNPRFGYEQVDKHRIGLPFEVPKENRMVIELFENGLKGVNGILQSGHPSPLSANRGFWIGNQYFSQTNHWLKSKNVAPIQW